MSFNLGNWDELLSCDLCSDDELLVLGGLPAFSDDDDILSFGEQEPPEPYNPNDWWEGEFEMPDYYPSMEFPDGGFIIEYNGIF
jgi:hypothetical protein